MTKGKIVLVPFPFDDLSAAKVRPAICLTNPIGPHRHVVFGFITSRIADPLLTSDLVIDAQHPDFAKTGHRVSSTLRLHRLMTIPTSIILRELGILSANLQQQVDQKLKTLFNLSV
ncbi:MAG: type II toxin-antitoxin system PemK/MazF family toxin [Candidatus Poribacteria bacterium]|nr:type II toxin-antitoxin system PemK/MazF family toxin [Candidatus Poribacteria bacterium]